MPSCPDRRDPHAVALRGLQRHLRLLGRGDRPNLLDANRVPPDCRAQTVHLRAGDPCDALACLTPMRDGRPMRLFPVGAEGAIHVPPAVLGDLEPDSRIEVLVSAREGAQRHMVFDLGLMEI